MTPIREINEALEDVTAAVIAGARKDVWNKMSVVCGYGFHGDEGPAGCIAPEATGKCRYEDCPLLGVGS